MRWQFSLEFLKVLGFLSFINGADSRDEDVDGDIVTNLEELSEILSIYQTFPKRMSLRNFGHALTNFDPISVWMGVVAIWWWVLWQHGVPLSTESDSDKSAAGSSRENVPGRWC